MTIDHNSLIKPDNNIYIYNMVRDNYNISLWSIQPDTIR
jgi:hypothetical protein